MNGRTKTQPRRGTAGSRGACITSKDGLRAPESTALLSARREVAEATSCERDLAEANRLVGSDSRYTGLRPFSAADLRVAPADGSVNAARLIVYGTLAERAIRDESAGVRAEKAKPFLGTWADGPIDDGFRDPREKGLPTGAQ